MKIIPIVSLLMLSGCATITRGTEELVGFESSPSGATVRTSIGLGCPSTPCSINVSRKTPFSATFSKAGFEEKTVDITTEMSGGGTAGLAGNILFGGVIGVGTDAVTGATLDHTPNPARVVLDPIPAPPPPVTKPAVKGRIGKPMS